MAVSDSATPLIGLDAVVIDTETTGLDPRKARVVEFAALRLVGGKLDEAQRCRTLVKPGVAIPAQATRIHGIDTAAVEKAPAFAAAWPEVQRFIGKSVVIGHSVGFDLAVLKRECERAGIAWTPPRFLDTCLLAELAAPNLAGYALDAVASWLEIEIANRHSAEGDALAAGRIFLALLPKLREGGVRTLGEAERACRALTQALEQQHRAGWLAPQGAPKSADAEADALRVDTYPYRHHVRDIMSAPARFMAPDQPVAAALERMAEAQVSSLFVRLDAEGETPPRPDRTGILTERDVMRVLAQRGASALQVPVGELASRPLATVPADALAFLAMARMTRIRVRHLGVTDAAGHVVGAVSARDLLRMRTQDAVSLGDEIAQAADVPSLAAAWAKLPRAVAALRNEELSGHQIAALVSHQLCALTQRAAMLAQERMDRAGQGGPPCAFAFAVLGSAGRGESLLAMDQDNALIFAEGAEGGDNDRWFGALATHVAEILHEVGVPYCKGGVMAMNPPWRGSLATWRQRIAHWVRRSSPQDLLAVDIFFDMRGVRGDIGLADSLWREAFAAARGQHAFAKLLVDTGGGETGLNFFGGFRTRDGRVDVKKAGLFGIVSAARALAVCHHVVEHSTPARLAGIKALGLRGAGDLDGLANAQAVFMELLVAQQIDDMAHGIGPSNAVAVKDLAPRDRERVRTALKAVAHLEPLTRDLLLAS
jgi:CBS domain-containing protein